MLGKLFQKKGSDDAAHIPIGKRVYAIGDIHGCLDELDTVLQKIQDDCASTDLAASVFKDEEDSSAQSKPKLVFLGDYVDRGPDSKGVLDRLTKLQKTTPDTIFLKGNHEALMLEFLAAPDATERWLDWGGDETLQSYGISTILGRRNEDLAAELKERLPAEHLTFLNNLSLTHQEGDYLFVHAGIRPGVPLADQKEEDLLWIRKKFHKMNVSERPSQVVVHGHQPVEKPLDAGWRIDVDTGACWSGRLTAVALEGTSRRFIST